MARTIKSIDHSSVVSCITTAKRLRGQLKIDRSKDRCSLGKTNNVMMKAMMIIICRNTFVKHLLIFPPHKQKVGEPSCSCR